jgi:hypothetical protein
MTDLEKKLQNFKKNKDDAEANRRANEQNALDERIKFEEEAKDVAASKIAPVFDKVGAWFTNSGFTVTRELAFSASNFKPLIKPLVIMLDNNNIQLSVAANSMFKRIQFNVVGKKVTDKVQFGDKPIDFFLDNVNEEVIEEEINKAVTIFFKL